VKARCLHDFNRNRYHRISLIVESRGYAQRFGMIACQYPMMDRRSERPPENWTQIQSSGKM
jgi:hypothetical protein